MLRFAHQVVKNLIYVIALLCLTSCAATRSGSTLARHNEKPSSNGEPRFLENIVIRSQPTMVDDETSVNAPKRVRARKDIPGSTYSSDIERCHNLQFKYAILLGLEVETVTNEKLIAFLESWYGIPYKYGGSTRNGIDCSAFTSLMMDSIYNVSLPRTSRAQYDVGKRVSKNSLKQGDLVFFNTRSTRGNTISHVGVYLNNNKFVHASVSSGVMISDLDDVYFRRRYVGAARLL